MQCNVIRLFVPVFMLCVATWGMAQQQVPSIPQPAQPQSGKPPTEKSKLEEMLAEALKNNADIRVAAARLAEADAELNRTRLQVIQKIVTVNQDIDSARKGVESAKGTLDLIEANYRNGQRGVEKVLAARTELVNAKAKLAATEAELPYLLGKSPQAEYMQTIQEAKLRREASRLQTIEYEATLLKLREKQPNPSGAMAERIRKALQTPVKVDYKDATLSEILKDLQKKAPGLSFKDISGRGGHRRALQFEEPLPASAVLQAIADYFELTFLVRDYGILVTEPKVAPPGAITVQEFLRQKPPEK